MAIFDKLKHLSIGEDSLSAAGPTAPVGSAPDTRSIYQNRFNFGVNFGSLFVLEKFIFHQFFIHNTNTEFEAISAYIREYGSDKTREALENHWNNYVNDDDWRWLKSKGVTGIRVPIGYWHVNGGYFTKDTPYHSIASVYKNAWVIFKNLIAKAKEYDIGILVDLHALPGGANAAEHSGIELKKAEFWGEKKSQKAAVNILEFIAGEFKDAENIIGLQIVNESEFSNHANAQKSYYSRALKHIRKVSSNIPVVISDGWWPDQWVKWITEAEQNLGGQSLGIVIDTHVYRCFSDNDKRKAPEQIIQDLDGDLLTNLSGSADILVGEYSHVLDGQSWSKTHGDRGELVKRYGSELQKYFQKRANVGSFFWTYKFQQGDGGEWGFRAQIDNGALPTRFTTANSIDEEYFKKFLDEELNSHSNYWNEQNKKEKYEHWRYQEGFTTGWADAVAFSKFNGSRLGRLNAWKSSRREEHKNHRNDSPFLWEWEQGFDKGVARAEQALFGN